MASSYTPDRSKGTLDQFDMFDRVINIRLTGLSSIAWNSIGFLQIPTAITKSVTEESLTCGIAIPLPIAVDINSSRFNISAVSSCAFFT